MSSEDFEDVEFLKDQVHRLSVSLSQYQKKNLPADDELLKPSGSEPWLTNKRYLSPLVAEYDQTIEELNQQISMYQTELESMTSRVEHVTQENARLHSELRKSLEVRIQASTQPGSRGLKSSGGVDVGSALDTLQQRLEIVTKDRDSYRDLLKNTSHELDLLQRNDQDKSRKLLESKAGLIEAQQASISTRKKAEELELNYAKLDDERIRCLKTVKAQEAELSALQDNLSNTKIELRVATTKSEELKESLDEITFQLKKRESEKARAMDTENSLDDRVHIMQITNTDLEGKFLAAQREITILNGEKIDLEETLSSVQTRVSALEQREYEAVCHVKESMQIAESALLEKEQATIKEQQLAREVDRLKSTMATIVKEAGERTKREVDILREECNKSIDKMGIEIHRLEQEYGERQAQLERSQREKKVVEKELEKALAKRPLEIVQTGESLHEFQKRMCVAERAKDDALVKLEAVTAANKRQELNLADEKQAHGQLDEEHRRWQRQVQEESQKLREQKIKAMAHADDLKQKLRFSEQAREAAELKLVQELVSLERKLVVREKEMAYRLEGSEEAHQKSIQELRGLLTAQHRVGTKWREESKSLGVKFERTITDLKSELVRYRSRSDELTKQLNHLKQVKDDLSKRLKEALNSNSNFHQRLKEAEAQSKESMDQVSELVSHEKMLLQERRELNRQLDKLKLYLRRNTEPAPHHMHSSLSKLPMGTSTQHILATGSHHYDLPHTSLLHSQPPLPAHHETSSHSQWNQTLSQLKDSIQQVRKDLQLGLGDEGRGGLRGQVADDDTLSEHSALSRGDLSHSSHLVS